jgi:hypothetical protein
MQYRRALVILLLAVLVPPHAASGTETPSPTQNVARLKNFPMLISFLNLASGTVRLVAILEPSAESSQTVMRAVQTVLDANPSKRLRAYVVWTRAGEADTEMRALSYCSDMHDRRVVYFWDADAAAANSFRDVLGAGESMATGVVLLYDTDARLALTPPAPAMWMSVNPKIEGAVLDPSSLGAQANEMVRRVEAKVTDGTQPKP